MDEKLDNYLPGLKTELNLVYKDVDLDSKEELLKKLEKKDWVVTKEKIIRSQNCIEGDQTEKFEDNLTPQQEDYLNKAYGNRFIDMKNASFPFLKSLHKIHNMSEEEIKKKDLSVLNFGPEVDAQNCHANDERGKLLTCHE